MNCDHKDPHSCESELGRTLYWCDECGAATFLDYGSAEPTLHVHPGSGQQWDAASSIEDPPPGPWWMAPKKGAA